MKKVLRFWVSLFLLFASTQLSAAIRADLDKSQVSLGETIRLTLTLDDQNQANQIDTSVLDDDFNVVGRNIRSQVTMRNGSTTSEIRLELSLQAKRMGKLDIPALTIGTDKTQPLSVQVNKPSQQSANAGGEPPVLIEAEWENTGRPYVQSELNMVIRIYHAANLTNASLDEPRPNDAVVTRLGNDKQGRRKKNGVDYQILERRYAVFPQKSGNFVVPSIPMQMQVRSAANRQGGGIFGLFNQRTVTIATQALEIDVLPRPSQDTSEYWLPAENITLNRTGLPEKSVATGEAINMQIDLTAQGLNAAQLPEVRLPDMDSLFSVYPDTASLDNQTDGRVIQGTRKQTFVLIAKKSGMLTIPRINLNWWDKNKDQQMQASLPAFEIEVVAADSEPISTLPEVEKQATSSEQPDTTILSQAQITKTSEPQYWKWLAISSFIAWGLTLFYFLFYRSWPKNKHSENAIVVTNYSRAVAKIKQAANANQADAVWRSLQEYSRLRWPSSAPKSPLDWANKLGHANVQPILTEVESHLFSGQNEASWNGEQFRQKVLPVLAEASASKSKTTNENKGVPEMYPT